MNMTELIQAYFSTDATEHLARATGLDAQSAQRALGVGLPMQLDALAAHAGNAQGQAQIAEAIQNLPAFGSVQAALNEPDGAANLARAGELLGPALLGGQGASILNAVTGQLGVGANSGGVQKLLNMALPLLLSFLGQRGVNAGNLGGMLGNLKGSLGGLLGGAAVTHAAGTVTGQVPGNVVGNVSGAVAQTAGLNAGGLIDLIKAQFGGANADRIAGAAGFGGGNGQRAVMAALPLVLGALSTKGKTESGAADILSMAKGFTGLSDATGNLNLGFLDNNAEVSRIEGQGRGLLGNLFGNVDEITGRLGSALGGSGSNAGRLLSLVAPLLLSLIGGRASASNMNAGGLSGLLGGLTSLLPGLLPSGLTSLTSLLTGQPATPTTKVATTVTPATPAPAPRPVTTTTTTTTPVVAEKRGGFPWWLIPLLLLLGLGGCWLLKPKGDANKPVVATEQAASILVTNPTSGATLPAEPFTMSGTGPASTSLRIEDQGQEVAKADIGADGTWSADLPAPTVGEHTYSVIGGEGVRSEFKVNITDKATGETPATETPATETPATGTFAISEPAADATLAAGGFTLKGTGKPGDSLQVLEDGTSLGNVTVGDDGTWSLDVPSPTAGAHKYTVQGADGTELGSVSTTIGEADANASAADCTDEYSLSISDNQTVNEPFRFGGKGNGKGYSVTVKRGERTIGTKDVPLDSTCGWSYQSKPGAGTITYEVRPMGDAAAAALSTVNLTVKK